MKSRYIKEALKSLKKEENRLSEAFQKSAQEVGVRFCYLDNFLPESMAREIYEAFPPLEKMRFMNSRKERKYTSKSFDEFNPILKEITFAIQEPEVVQAVESITRIPEQKGDPTLYAGGLSAMVKGNYLNPHIDNSHDMNRENYRTLNLLYYTTPGWRLHFGGNLELWNRKVDRNVTIESRFNRLVLMETNPFSWHSVSPVTAEGVRTCVSNYYFSSVSPIGEDYFNVTSFHGRPGRALDRILLPMDSKLRCLLRRFRRTGFGRKDIYEPGSSPHLGSESKK